ncbi:MAG: hypothetical protein J0M08_05950 [Bacteroidetes bacterium]|nr:hypothetical protein [Bacteroidota bacterium]
MRDEKNVVAIAKQNFVDDKGNIEEGLLDIGNTLPMLTQDGHRMHGIVKSVTDTTVEMDFNHPLAGEDLHFAGEVVEVRAATADEIAHGHVHGPGGHHH